MKFENSEKIRTKRTVEEVLKCLEEHIRKVSGKVSATSKSVTAQFIEATFGSVNRNDTTKFFVTQKEGGILIASETNYRPSAWFWFFLVIGFFCGFIGMAIPIIFYLVHKNTVKEAINGVLRRVRDEMED